jgi:AbrB family looped-hinge helix DNA binding protein
VGLWKDFPKIMANAFKLGFVVDVIQRFISKICLTRGMKKMTIAVTRMSSKGQVVIPAEMRDDIKEGEQLLIIKTDEQIIMKRATKLDKKLAEDLEFSRRIRAAWKEYDEGKFTSSTAEEFLEEMKKW